jgi:hypothetical protein
MPGHCVGCHKPLQTHRHNGMHARATLLLAYSELKCMNSLIGSHRGTAVGSKCVSNTCLCCAQFPIHASPCAVHGTCNIAWADSSNHTSADKAGRWLLRFQRLISARRVKNQTVALCDTTH